MIRNILNRAADIARKDKTNKAQETFGDKDSLCKDLLASRNWLMVTAHRISPFWKANKMKFACFTFYASAVTCP